MLLIIVSGLFWEWLLKGDDFGTRVYPLPLDGRIDEMPGWRAIHTPGQTARHIYEVAPVSNTDFH